MAHTVALNTHTGHVHAPPLDATRIVGQAAAIAVNAALLLALLAPLSAPPMAPTVEEVIEAVFIPPKPPLPVPVVIEPRTRPTPPRPVPVVQPRTAPPPVAPVLADSQPGDEVAPPPTPLQADVPTSIEPPASTGSQLQTLRAPAPSYPPQAVREGLTGVVELEILVDVDGKPLEARVTRSSGHRMLDQAARRAVLSRWTFQPAIREGQPVQALGRVPIEFKLDR